jgi:hypothetical protein
LQMVASGHWLFSQPHKPIVCIFLNIYYSLISFPPV